MESLGNYDIIHGKDIQRIKGVVVNVNYRITCIHANK